MSSKIKKYLSKIFLKRKRAKDVKLTNSSPRGLGRISKIFKVVLSNFLRIISILFVFLVLIYVIFVSFKVLNIKFQQLDRGMDKISWEGKDRINLVVIGGDTQKNDYIFIDYLCLIEIDLDDFEIKLFNINPLFIIQFSSENEIVTIKNSFATYKGREDTTGLDELLKGVQRISANKVDGYIYISKEGFSNIFSQLGSIDIEAPTQVVDPDLPQEFVIEEGEKKVNLSNLIYFLAADNNGQNDKMIRQLNASEAFLTKISLVELILHFPNISTNIEKEIKTNLSIIDMLRLLYISRFKKQMDYKVGYTQSHPGYIMKTSMGEVWTPVYEDIDRDLQKILTQNEVKLEQARVDILNSTDIAGLAQTRARWLSNRGIRVVLTGNYPEKKFQVTQIFVKQPEKYFFTLKEIRSTFNGDVEIIPQKYPGRAFGEIVVILGENEPTRFLN